MPRCATRYIGCGEHTQAHDKPADYKVVDGNGETQYLCHACLVVWVAEMDPEAESGYEATITVL
jgi:hypothetical protein